MTSLPDPFAAPLTAQRRARLVGRIEQEHQGVPMLVTDPANIRYLTGFAGSAGALLVSAAGSALYTDSRYLEQALALSGELAVEHARDPITGALEVIADVLVEGHHVTAADWLRISASHPDAELVGDLVAELRAVKDDAELAVLEYACALSAEALLAVLDEGLLGRTERGIARRLGWLLGEGAGEGPGFDIIVASGPNSAVPHHRPTDRHLAKGDLLKIDFGASALGYHADITRTFVVAADPEPWQLDIHGLVARAAQAARDAVRDGAGIRAVDASARRIIEEAGHGGHFGHGLGHGVGLAIHERPLIGPRSDGTLAAGMAITIEPGVYLPRRGGVRIEDTLHVQAESARCLAELARDLITVS